MHQNKVDSLTIQDANNLISNAIPVITILGTIFGASITYSYLDSINQKSIFPDIIGTPSAFLSVSIVFSLMLFAYLYLYQSHTQYYFLMKIKK